uniref:Uncharacterized protein n=1 Tax=Arundo donax TaxID=35708 RepID=A0A0A8ZMF5_ARUDO
MLVFGCDGVCWIDQTCG